MPAQDVKPMARTEYRVSIELAFKRGEGQFPHPGLCVGVLLTNFPRSNADVANTRFGATVDTVMITYLGYYHVEHVSG